MRPSASIRQIPTSSTSLSAAIRSLATRIGGVYRTTDGGKTWKNLLFVSDLTGAADLELQPGNPSVVFACMWHGQRKPWTIISGAMEGGIYKSTDAGDHWTKLAGGLPNQLFGRSNVAISAANPKRIYALIEAKPGSGLYRSEDTGATWTLVNGSGSLITRPFYYTTLGVDPNNPEVVWIGDEGWFKSTDGGKTFRNSPVPHGDNHDVWINPKNSDYMIQGNDGGAVVSLDGGRTWSSEDNQPTAEIYQVAVDNQYPYRVYGAQQDSTTVIVPSLALGNGQAYRTGPGCETGPIIPDRDQTGDRLWRLQGPVHAPEHQYERRGAVLGGSGIALRQRRRDVALPLPARGAYGSFTYPAAHRLLRIAVHSPHPRWRHYMGDHQPGSDRPSRFRHLRGVHRTRAASRLRATRRWEEVYSVVYAIKESPIEKGLIWSGSNDGPVYVTRDDGKTWTNVTPKDLPPGGRVQNIEASPHRAGTAYIAVYRFLLGDFAPYIYRTDDYGKSWTRLTDGKNGIAADEPTRVVREDPDRAGLLYAGTEFGIYISFDNGAHWQSFQMNLPVSPVTDIRVAHKDLILSTQGRSFWILDNLTPLHQLNDQNATSSAILFTPREGIRTTGRGGGRGSAIRYPQPGADIDYYLAAAPKDDIKMEILDENGNVVRKFSSAGGGANDRAAVVDDAPPPSEDEEGGGGGGRGRGGPTRLEKGAGMHRFTWDLRYFGPWMSVARPEWSQRSGGSARQVLGAADDGNVHVHATAQLYRRSPDQWGRCHHGGAAGTI